MQAANFLHQVQKFSPSGGVDLKFNGNGNRTMIGWRRATKALR
jgi:hypothetical protein